MASQPVALIFVKVVGCVKAGQGDRRETVFIFVSGMVEIGIAAIGADLRENLSPYVRYRTEDCAAMENNSRNDG